MPSTWRAVQHEHLVDELDVLDAVVVDEVVDLLHHRVGLHMRYADFPNGALMQQKRAPVRAAEARVDRRVRRAVVDVLEAVPVVRAVAVHGEQVPGDARHLVVEVGDAAARSARGHDAARRPATRGTGSSAKSSRRAFSACAVLQIVTGPSRSQTKSTASSRIVCSGSAAGWVPVMRIATPGFAASRSCAMRPGGGHVLRRGRGLEPVDDDRDERRREVARVTIVRRLLGREPERGHVEDRDAGPPFWRA